VLQEGPGERIDEAPRGRITQAAAHAVPFGVDHGTRLDLIDARFGGGAEGGVVVDAPAGGDELVRRAVERGGDLAADEEGDQVAERLLRIGALGRGRLRGRLRAPAGIGAVDAQARDDATVLVVDDGVTGLVVGQVFVAELGEVGVRGSGGSGRWRLGHDGSFRGGVIVDPIRVTRGGSSTSTRLPGRGGGDGVAGAAVESVPPGATQGRGRWRSTCPGL
jgi:hypothetical protein